MPEKKDKRQHAEGVNKKTLVLVILLSSVRQFEQWTTWAYFLYLPSTIFIITVVL